MKKWIAAILTLVMLSQALPWTAFAATGDMITDSELRRAMSIAGLQFESASSGDESALSEAMPKSAIRPRLEAMESGYHPGMQPDETWNAQMLLDWLDDMLKKDIYYVSSTFMNAQTILERMGEENPEKYAYFTDSEKWTPEYYKLCRSLVELMEDAKSQACFLRTRITDQVLVIEQNAEALSAGADTLFDHEKVRLSIQIQEAADALEKLREEVLKYAIVQILWVVMGEMLLEGNYDDLDDFPDDIKIPQAFNEWIMSVLDSEGGIQEVSVPSTAVMSAGYNTRMSRMRAESRPLANNYQDVRVMVITENDFAVELRGVDNAPVEGVKVTVTDLNGRTVATRYTEDPKVGSAVFNANDFNCDYDKEMELSLEVDASAQGYRSFYIPWLLLKRGGVYRQTLTLLTGPEAEAADSGEAQEASFAASDSGFKPYVYACTFNGYDILRQDKNTIISKVNDGKFNFELELAHPSGKAPGAPVLHCWVERKDGKLTRIVEETFTPTSHVTLSSGHTKYIYTDTWKRDLSPDISKDKRPYFVLPDTGEVVRTTLQPVRSKIDKPIFSGQETSNPFNSVLGKGFGLNVNIPVIGGKLTLDLPFDKYLPKINVDPTGYVIIMFGSTALKDPSDATLWKSREAEAYDKSMKQYQHDMSVARKKQAAGTAKSYYKKFGESKPQTRIKFDFGYFMMFSGRWQSDDANGDSLWSVNGATGAEFVFSAEYTQMFSIGPVPFYLTATFTASMGLSLDGLYFSFLVDKDLKLKNFEWSLVRGISLNIRLMLSVTLGFGLKGICSVWVRATGGLNLIIHILMKQPVHIAIYGEFFLNVGFELFWIKYSKEIWRSPYWKIYSNYELKSRANFNLFSAYADGPDADEAEKTPLEPTRYPALAPVAKKILTNQENVQTGIKVVEFQGHTLVFYIGMAKDSAGKDRRYVQWMDMANGQITVPARGRLQGLEDYAFDVMTNGNCIAIFACCAESFDEDGFPVTGTIQCYTTIIASDYSDVEPDSDLTCLGIFPNKLNLKEVSYNGIDNPRIEAVRSDITSNKVSFRVYGSCDAYYDVTKERGSIGFEVATEGYIRNHLMLFSDKSVKSAFNDANERVVVRSDGRSMEAYSGSVLLNQFPSPGFIALSRPRGDEEGEGGIELFDFEMNAASATPSIVGGRRTYTDSKRKAVALVEGDIDHIEVVQTIGSDGKNSARTVFYSQLETKGELTEKRLRSVYVAPRQGDSNDFSYDVTYTDYDVSIPAEDFRVVTLGASQYLYWLSTVSKKNESDPDLWRISGLYYDTATGTMSDQIVIAEFSLPDAAWKGKTWRSVPFEITLTESGVGYITARPETGSEKDDDIAPLTLYSFPITLKPVLDMRCATLMETTVCQGELISTDFSMMNEGNMGIGSFDIEMYMMKGDEQGEKIETLHADCIHPENSKVVLHGANGVETVVKGEQAFYRLKDFEYTPRQNEWIVKNQSRTITVKNATQVSVSDGTDKFRHVATNVLVPGALGGYTGMIKIPIDWKGSYDLRLKLTNVSTYSNWLAVAALAMTRPDLFEENEAKSGAMFAAKDAGDTLAELGIQKLVYTLDEASGKLVLQKPPALLGARKKGESDDTLTLYAAEIEAPEPVDINCDVHDIDVGHRIWADYYGEEILDIIISNYHTAQEAIELNCAVYLDNSDTPRYISLPYDPSVLSAGKTTTITLPLKTFIPDADLHREARVVISGRGIAETATVNNEFTLYLGGSDMLTIIKQPRSQTAPVGGSAVFTVDVSGGRAPYKYQWQVFVDGEWRDIPGANEATLTLDKVKAKWNGRRTRCVITDANDITVISDEAVLTVIGQDAGADGKHPDTGDHMNLPLYLLVALSAVALLLILRRRERD